MKTGKKNSFASKITILKCVTHFALSSNLHTQAFKGILCSGWCEYILGCSKLYIYIERDSANLSNFSFCTMR